MVYKEKIPVIMKIVRIVFFVLIVMGASFNAMAQDDDPGDDETPCENKWGEDSAQTLRNLSMFNQYWQEKNYTALLPYWKYLFENAPCVKKRITYTGPYILKKCIVSGDFDDRKDGLIDTILLCYPKRIELYGDDGTVLGQWGRDLAALKPDLRDSAFLMMDRSIDMLGNETDYSIPKPYMLVAARMYQRKEMSLDSFFMAFEKVSQIIDYNIAQNGEKVEKWKSAQAAATKLVLPFIDCEKVIRDKEPLFEEKKNDISYLRITMFIIGLGDTTGACIESPFYTKLAEQYYSVEPTPLTALKIASLFERTGDDVKAEKYYLAALPGIEGQQKHDVYIRLSELSRKRGQLVQARDYARKALEINPNSGRAYIAIGDAYAATKGCTGECKELGGQEVYWAAVDKYIKAKQVDPSVAETANQRINKYTPYFPDKESAFFCGLIDGNSYVVGCWIGESTIIRTSGN